MIVALCRQCQLSFSSQTWASTGLATATGPSYFFRLAGSGSLSGRTVLVTLEDVFL
ncbi:hypothetical protein PO909_015170 [Leuciscus waleckii]